MKRIIGILVCVAVVVGLGISAVSARDLFMGQDESFSEYVARQDEERQAEVDEVDRQYERIEYERQERQQQNINDRLELELLRCTQ